MAVIRGDSVSEKDAEEQTRRVKGRGFQAVEMDAGNDVWDLVGPACVCGGA